MGRKKNKKTLENKEPIQQKKSKSQDTRIVKVSLE